MARFSQSRRQGEGQGRRREAGSEGSPNGSSRDGQCDALDRRVTATHRECTKERGGPAPEPQVPGLHPQSQDQGAAGGRVGHRQTPGPVARDELLHTRAPFRPGRRRAERHPAWLESVLRHHRGAEASSRTGQMVQAKVTLLSMETMGWSGMPRAAQVRRVCARRMECQQERAWVVAHLEDPGVIADHASVVLPSFGAAMPGTSQNRMSTQHTFNNPNRRIRDPYVRWCGREGP